MPDKYFLSVSGTDVLTSPPGERVLWSGRCAVAEYAFDEPASLPRWTLPEETEVFVTDSRVAYVDPASEIAGELRWPWPQHLRVQPGNRDTGRSATVTQIQLVCAGHEDAFPALVFAGGDLATVADADRLANVLRQVIARYRVENAGELGLSTPQSRMLSRLVIGPEFSNYQGGEGQTVSLLGAVPVPRPARTAGAPAFAGGSVRGWDPAAVGGDEPFLDEYFSAGASASGYALETYAGRGYAPQSHEADASGSFPAGTAPVSATPVSATPVSAGWALADRPGRAADAARARQAQHAEQIVHQAQPDLASRAADLAARVASLVSGGTDEPLARHETQTANLSAFLDLPPSAYPTRSDGVASRARPGDRRPDDAAERAEAIRRTAARFAGNSARARSRAPRRADEELGAPSRGHRNG
jgi:hypothetical protein